MKKKKNIFENKLQELNKLKVESKKEVLAKEQKVKDEKKEYEEYCKAETKKYLKGFDKERFDLKKFIKEVNKKFYKKYEINVINPPGINRDGLFCKDTGGYNATFVDTREQFKSMFDANIFSIDVLDRPFNNRKQSTTDIKLNYKNSAFPQWPNCFKVEVCDKLFGPAKYNKNFSLKEYGPKARKLAIEDFMDKLTDQIKLL